MNTKYNINDKVWIPVVYDKKNETYIVVDIYDNKTDNRDIKLAEAQSFNIDEIKITDKKLVYIHKYYPIFDNECAFSKSDRTKSWGLNNRFEDIVFSENIMFETKKSAEKEIKKALCKIIKLDFCCCCCKCCNGKQNININ
jgi:hypothetical protein